MSQPVHTYRVTAQPEHITEGYDCWCLPRVEMICSQCGDDTIEKASCWQCSGKGWIPCERPDLYDGAVGLLIVHNEFPP